jgi:hypothetical protein
MDAWAWSKRVGELLAEMDGAKGLLVVSVASEPAEEIAARHGLQLATVNGGILKAGAFLVTTDRQARGGAIDG